MATPILLNSFEPKGTGKTFYEVMGYYIPAYLGISIFFYTFPNRFWYNIISNFYWIFWRIKAYYSRHFDELRFIDSNDFYHTVIGVCEDGQWSNEIQIYSDKYQVTMNDYESGWIYDSLFSSNIPVNIRLYISLTGSIPEFWWRAGFDNILVESY